MLFITFVYPNHLTVAVTYYNRAFCVYPMPKSGQFRPIMDNEQGAHASAIYAPIWGVLYIVRRGLLFVATEGQSRASNR